MSRHLFHQISKKYNAKYTSNYREALEGYELARIDALEHFIPKVLVKQICRISECKQKNIL